MKLKPPLIKKLAARVYEALTRKKLLTILSSDKKVLEKIELVIAADVAKEDEIEKLARKMMEKFEGQVSSGEIDYRKMYLLVKKQIMKEKKFIP